MPFTKIWLHIVWATKNRAPLLVNGARQKVFAQIAANAGAKGIKVSIVNGHVEHVHILASLGADHSVAKVVQLLKGESAFWANKNGIIRPKLEWQEDYFAVSVSESNIDKMHAYIQNQEAHHQKKTFQQEYDEFITRYGFMEAKTVAFTPRY